MPQELVSVLPYDDNIKNIQRQKAATPVRESMPLHDVFAEFRTATRPNAVVLEKNSYGSSTGSAQVEGALRQAAEESDQKKATPELTLSSGNVALNQFEPWYYGLAFAFVFPLGLGMPDPPPWSDKPRHRRGDGDPHLGLPAWARLMARRIEAQINRDWTFGFVSWNVLFRSTANLTRSAYTFSANVFDEDEQRMRPLTATDLEQGALQLVNALTGSYRDITGKKRALKGDISKLPYVQGLKPGARKLLQSLRCVAKALPGTAEARRQMRLEIEAMRVRYGAPIFVTFSPDEAHQVLFIRMHRCRMADPVRETPSYSDLDAGDADWPPMEEADPIRVYIEQLWRTLPTWAERRQRARDPLAAVDGFRALVLLVLQHLFGMRVCPACPQCNRHGNGCQDFLGSSSTTAGGIFGRMDACYISFEAQKSSGNLHAHLQCFVQCLHQHTPLEELFTRLKTEAAAFTQACLDYNAHVAYARYPEHELPNVERAKDTAERTWPEHIDDNVMTSCATCQRRRRNREEEAEAEAKAWCHEYLSQDVFALQLLKQHHVHPQNQTSGEREPLKGCQRADKPNECKSGFPRTKWLCQDAAVLCFCKLARHGLRAGGRRNRLCTLFGPYNDAMLNPCHPAMLAALRGCNVDVQLPYRLPFVCAECDASFSSEELKRLVFAMQRAQDAQTGYCCDYCSKSQPMAFHEVREFQKGHVALHQDLSASYKPTGSDTRCVS